MSEVSPEARKRHNLKGRYLLWSDTYKAGMSDSISNFVDDFMIGYKVAQLLNG